MVFLNLPSKSWSVLWILVIWEKAHKATSAGVLLCQFRILMEVTEARTMALSLEKAAARSGSPEDYHR